MEISLSSDSITDDHITTKFGTCHDSPAVVPCAKFCSDHFISIGMRAKWNFHHIWIVMEKLLVKWSPDKICTWVCCVLVCFVVWIVLDGYVWLQFMPSSSEGSSYLFSKNSCNTVETLYSTIYYSKYFIELNLDKSTQYVALWTHKRHPIPRPFGRAMECLLWVFQQKLTVL